MLKKHLTSVVASFCVIALLLSACGETNELTNVAKYEDYTLTLDGATIETTDEGGNVIRVSATYTNNSSEPSYAYSCFSVRAFQNDTQITETSDINGNEANLIKEVKDGKSLSVTYVFELMDDSEVEVLVGEPTADCTTIAKETFPISADDSTAETSTSTEDTTGDEVIGVETDEEIVEVPADTFIETLTSYGYTEDEATEITTILKTCGIPSLQNLEQVSDNPLESVVAWRCKIDNDRIWWFTTDNRELFYVAYNDDVLYDADNGGYLKNFNDVHIPETSVTNDEFLALRDQSEKVLDAHFSSPRYYDAWGIAREDNTYMTYCEATDGSLLTDYWYQCYVWYEKQDSGEFVATGLKINGKFYELN